MFRYACLVFPASLPSKRLLQNFCVIIQTFNIDNQICNMKILNILWFDSNVV